MCFLFFLTGVSGFNFPTVFWRRFANCRIKGLSVTAVVILTKTVEKQWFLHLEELLSSLGLGSVTEIATEMVTHSSHYCLAEIAGPRLKCTIAPGGDHKTPGLSDRHTNLCASTESNPSHLPPQTSYSAPVGILCYQNTAETAVIY